MLWGAVYAICGTIQFVAGIYFMLELPIFQIGSNIWTGAWVSIVAAFTVHVSISISNALAINEIIIL